MWQGQRQSFPSPTFIYNIHVLSTFVGTLPSIVPDSFIHNTSMMILLLSSTWLENDLNLIPPLCFISKGFSTICVVCVGHLFLMNFISSLVAYFNQSSSISCPSFHLPTLEIQIYFLSCLESFHQKTSCSQKTYLQKIMTIMTHMLKDLQQQ